MSAHATMRGARVAAGLSLRELAARVEIDSVTLGELERGIRPMTLEERARIYEAICAAAAAGQRRQSSLRQSLMEAVVAAQQFRAEAAALSPETRAALQAELDSGTWPDTAAGLLGISPGVAHRIARSSGSCPDCGRRVDVDPDFNFVPKCAECWGSK
ncbi:MAG: helix-turn-helix transcriptional regulator [Sandaracinaceae bacterium]